MTIRSFTAYVEYDPETKLHVGIVPGIPGAHSQGETLDELRVNLGDVLKLCLEELGEVTTASLLFQLAIPTSAVRVVSPRQSPRLAVSGQAPSMLRPLDGNRQLRNRE